MGHTEEEEKKKEEGVSGEEQVIQVYSERTKIIMCEC